jgi:cytidyltransferase-like protein
MTSPDPRSPAVAPRKIMVAGCFDLLHASHVVFLNKAASLGDLYVSLGSDQSVVRQKNKSPTYTQEERKFLLENLRHVKWVGIVRDPGPTGFIEHMEQIRPDIFVINEDGDSLEKRLTCEQFGVEYLVFPRDNFLPDAPTSTTEISKGSYIPTRVSLCSGFMDNPTFNGATQTGVGHLVVLPIEPFAGMRERSGMASSTMKTVRNYFGCRLPTIYSVDRLAEIIFCLENPPHKRGYISGTLDSRGIVGNGANLFRYEAKRFFPAEIATLTDEASLSWLERHLYLRHSWDRPLDCVVRVRDDHPDFREHADRMNEASLACWEAIRQHDLSALAAAVRTSHQSQCAVVENHCPPELRAFIDRERAMAAMIMGAGGGGYVLFVAEAIPPDGIPIRVKRADY